MPTPDPDRPTPDLFPGARPALTSSAGQSLFIALTGIVLLALAIALFVFVRHAVNTPIQRKGVVLGTLLFSLLGLTGIALGIVDLVRRWKKRGGPTFPQLSPDKPDEGRP